MIVGLLVGLCIASPPAGGAAPGSYQDEPVRRLVLGLQDRLLLDSEIERIAVGDPEVLTEELLSTREVLLTAVGLGRTNVSLWYEGGGFDSFVYTVEPDLSLLRSALDQLDPSIRVEQAPDRDALVLWGLVSDVQVRRLAEATARAYLTAGAVGAPVLTEAGSSGAPPGEASAGSAERAQVVNLIRVSSLPALADARLGQAVAALGEAGVSVQRVVREGAPNDEVDQFLVEGTVSTPAALQRLRAVVASIPIGAPGFPRPDAVVDLVEVQGQATNDALEDRLASALGALTGDTITVSRLVVGSLPDDGSDVFVLQGKVPTQVALTRALYLAARLVGDERGDLDLRALSDESGALLQRGGTGQNNNLQRLFGQGGGTQSSVFGGGSQNLGRQLANLVGTNFARAKVHEAAEGRVLSFLEVRDIPQVRVTVELYEVNRSRLLEWDPDIVGLGSDFDQPALNPASGASLIQGMNAASVGANGREIQDVFSFLENGFANQLQFSGAKFALDATFRLLEAASIARSLSRPSMTVLSGEPALFQVGGEVPIQSAVATPGFGATGDDDLVVGGSTVFSTIQFRSFGVQLAARPLVDDQDRITIDVTPQIVLPDADLTTLLVDTTGTDQATTAFESRSLRTSARLTDGQSLVLAGLMSRNASDGESRTPLLSSIPVLGWLFTDRNRQGDDLELVIVITPTILRDPLPDAGLWRFPDARELVGDPPSDHDEPSVAPGAADPEEEA